MMNNRSTTEESNFFVPFAMSLGIALAIGLFLWFGYEAPRHEDPSALESAPMSRNQKALLDSYVKKVFFGESGQRLKRVESASDGRHGTRAAVSSIDGYGAVWKMWVDPKDSFNGEKLRNEKNFVGTLVHELGHIVLLNDNQIDYYSPKKPLNSCINQEIALRRGCVRESAYLNNFIRNYWSAEDLAQVMLDEKSGNIYKMARKRYRYRADEFITPYAATSPVEDSAESFQHYIVGDLNEAKGIAGEKVHFFSQFPELVALRRQLRARLNFD